MLNTDIMKSEAPPHTGVKGSWFLIQWSPDRAGGERLNVGVGFQNESGRLHLRMLDYFERLTCLLDESYVFHLDLAIQVARESLLAKQSLDAPISPQIKVEARGFAKGRNEDEVLERLYHEVVPLGRKRRTVGKREFKTVNLEAAYTRTNIFLQQKLGIEFSKYVPENPYRDGGSGHKLYLPYQRKDGAGTLASASYAEELKVKCNLHDSRRDLDLALAQEKGMQHGAVFILMPGPGLKKSKLTAIENEVDEFEWYAKKTEPRLKVFTGDSPEKLSDLVAGWCVAA